MLFEVFILREVLVWVDLGEPSVELPCDEEEYAGMLCARNARGFEVRTRLAKLASDCR